MKHILTCMALLFSSFAAAQTYVVGVEQDNFMPRYGFDEQGQYSGFARD